MNITPKRKLASETISNVFLVLWSDVPKFLMCKSDLAEHGFGNMSRIWKEFSCTYFLSLVEKLQRQINMIFRGDWNELSSMYGYQATFENWIEQAKVEGIGLESGLCVINLDNDAAPICDQLWLFVSKIIDGSVRIMTPLLKLAGVEENNMSPFYKIFTLSKDLLDAYITYRRKKFSYDVMDGTTKMKKFNEIDDSDQQQAEEKPGTQLIEPVNLQQKSYLPSIILVLSVMQLMIIRKIMLEL